MRFRPSRVGGALVAVALLLAAGPASANPVDSQDNSLSSQFDGMAAKLKADGERAMDAAAEMASRAVAQSQNTLTAAGERWAPRLQTFRQMLNDQKANLAIIGADAARRLNAWQQAATESWAEAWADPQSESWSRTLSQTWAEFWTDSWAEMQRSTRHALDPFRDWFEKPPVSETTEIPV